MAKKGKKQKTYSTIEQHTQQGKTLVPPLMRVPFTFMSWINDRLPEVLWAALLVSHLERQQALSIFRKVANFGDRFKNSQSPVDITHTGLSQMPPEILEELLQTLCLEPAVRAALSPLTLLDDLPAKDHWSRALQTEPRDEYWDSLMRGVAKTLDHQSQEATDCRWCRVLFLITAGKLVFRRDLEEIAKEIVYYPEYGDPRKVRPSIRAIEGTLDGTISGNDDWPTRDWPTKFWTQCLRDTPCLVGDLKIKPLRIQVATTIDRVNILFRELVEHCNSTRTTSKTDAKHDAVFGIALFSLSILWNLLQFGINTSVIGRMGLRAMLECYVTLSYLVKKNALNLWLNYRNYGIGQAKLAFLKLDECENIPNYIDVETLEELGNEDHWQEFVSIDLGHWDKVNLRKMSQDAGVKDEYDRYYPWTSGFVHGHWGAVRDTVFQTCFNPLHRFHRIPRQSGARHLNDVIPDACYLADKILEIVDRIYPNFPHRATLNKTSF